MLRYATKGCIGAFATRVVSLFRCHNMTTGIIIQEHFAKTAGSEPAIGETGRPVITVIMATTV